MPSYEFTGPDPIDHFHLGRIAPGDVVDAGAAPGAAWKPAKSRPSRQQSDEQPPSRTEHGSDTPDAPEEA